MAEKKTSASSSTPSDKPKKKISLIKKSDLAKSKAEKAAKKKAVKTVEAKKVSAKVATPVRNVSKPATKPVAAKKAAKAVEVVVAKTLVKIAKALTKVAKPAAKVAAKKVIAKKPEPAVTKVNAKVAVKAATADKKAAAKQIAAVQVPSKRVEAAKAVKESAKTSTKPAVEKVSEVKPTPPKPKSGKPVKDISQILKEQNAAESPAASGKKLSAKASKLAVARPEIALRVIDLSMPAGSKSSGKAPKEEVELTAPPKDNPHGGTFIKKQKERLEDLYDELLRVINGTAREVIRNAPEGSEASGSGQHQGDAGSDAYDREFALSMLAKEQDSLYEIEQALYRIKKGIYGVCEISFKKIPQPRLEALPFTRLTIECQQQWEKENGNRRFRPSNEIGFSGGNYAEDDDSDTVSLDEDDE